MSSRFGSRVPNGPNWQKLALDLRVLHAGYDFGLPICHINEEIAVIEAGLGRLPKLTRMGERTRAPDHSRVRAFNGLTKSPTSQPGDRQLPIGQGNWGNQTSYRRAPVQNGALEPAFGGLPSVRIRFGSQPVRASPRPRPAWPGFARLGKGTRIFRKPTRYRSCVRLVFRATKRRQEWFGIWRM
jgi:hypothetical protein